jgi:hypothetical protein
MGTWEMSPRQIIFLVLLSLWGLLGILGPHKDIRTNPPTPLTHTHTHTPMQDYDMLLIATIIGDSLPENCSSLWRLKARCSWIQKKKREGERERERERERDRGRQEGEREKKVAEGRSGWERKKEKVKEGGCNVSCGAMQHSAQKGLWDSE